jgi:23S rRNA pseudouridine2605 synthase
MSDDVRPDANEPELDGPENDAPSDDVTAADEATAAAESDTFEQASDDSEPEPIADDGDGEPVPPGKLERLQKILAQAGVASRRAAENLITAGRVQVNGKVVTELGTKADAARDHIRVDGKLLQGSERLRYFMLNKPRGFVTTVRDPEGRATVMEFFAKLRERLYPVGRLDYLSEGLLLVTNDGDLANKLTRAAAGVEKTYLVKVSGEPTEDELDRLRSGVGIERGKPGSGRVQTAPAQIRKVRQGDNPWYEVILIEGRNRELRKMFEEIGHHVEKIRRVGYGPLVLDIEPGKMRELEAEELDDLRKTADGKPRKPKLKDIRRRKAMDAQLPTIKSRAPRPFAAPPAPPPAEFPSSARPAFAPRREFPPKRQFGTGRPSRPEGEGFRPGPERAGTGPARFGSSRPGLQRSGPPRPATPSRSDSPRPGAGRPVWKKDDRTARPPARFGERPPRSEQRPAQFGSAPPRQGRPASGFAGSRRPEGGRPFEKKPWKKPDSDRPNRPAFKPHAAAPRRDAAPDREEIKTPRPSRLQIEAVEPERESPIRPNASRPPTGRPATGRPPFRNAGAGRTGERRPGQFRPRTDRPASDRPRPDRAGSDRRGPDRPRPDRPSFDRPSFVRPAAGRPSSDRPGGARPAGGPGRTGAPEFGAGRPPRAEGDRSRPFTTSTGKPRAGGARPGNKRSGSSSAGKPAWKPKTGGAGGFSKSGPGFKSKTGAGRKPAAGRPSGKRPGGKPGGKKRG